MHYETATRFKRSIKPPANRLFMTSAHSQREVNLRKWERIVRNDRLDELNALIHRHRGDKNYAASVATWRREKLDLLERF